MKKKSVLWFLTGALVSSISISAVGAKKRKPDSTLNRPPQFVLLAFDGSKDLSFWDESLEFADKVPTIGGSRKIKFSYFINPVYYLAPENKNVYKTPELGSGRSCIGWSGSAKEIPLRIARTNKAFEGGHEIGSHANAHCDQTGRDKGDPMFGKPWNEAAWSSEFNQFNYLLFSAFQINKVSISTPAKFPNGFSFQVQDIVGFRAPKLAVTDGLWPTLQKYHFRYDTSRTSPPDYWPQKQVWGGWNFPLAQIKIAGTQKKTLSMDYNWLFYHSAGKSKPNLSDKERQHMYDQMLASYNYYFKKNYFGNRAPVHIGHHFSKWNRGVYWSVMQDFAKFVCNKPEVRCVTYKEYADWLDGFDTATLDTFRHGQFEKLKDDGTIKDIATPVLADVRLEVSDKNFEAFVPEQDRSKVEVLGWKAQLQVNFVTLPEAKMSREALLTQFKDQKELILRAVLTNRSGTEVNWQTYKVENFGKMNEIVTGPLEDRLLEGEGPEAHDGE